MKVIYKWLSVIFALLGCAFLGGSYLASVQGFLTQIGILATVGGICLILAAGFLALHFWKAKK